MTVCGGGVSSDFCSSVLVPFLTCSGYILLSSLFLDFLCSSKYLSPPAPFLSGFILHPSSSNYLSALFSYTFKVKDPGFIDIAIGRECQDSNNLRTLSKEWFLTPSETLTEAQSAACRHIFQGQIHLLFLPFKLLRDTLNQNRSRLWAQYRILSALLFEQESPFITPLSHCKVILSEHAILAVSKICCPASFGTSEQ